MKIKELKLGSKNIQKQKEFYADILGFETEQNSTNKITVKAGFTKLVFSEELESPELYHFAFLTPAGSVEACMQFVESREIELLPFEGDKVIHFDTGRSIYFFDADGNIAEFIERPSLDYPPKETFDINDVICLNEIGLPVQNTLEISHELMSSCSIRPINPKAWNENFCWVGDHEGAVIVVKEGRHWMPTEIPAVINDLEIEYEENNISMAINCKSGKLLT